MREAKSTRGLKMVKPCMLLGYLQWKHWPVQKTHVLKVASAKLYVYIWLLLHFRQRLWFSFPQILPGERDGDSPPPNSSVQLRRGQEGARLHPPSCANLHQASHCWPCACYLSRILGKLHWERLQDQWLADSPLLEKASSECTSRQPTSSASFPHWHLCNFSFWGRGWDRTGKHQLFFLHLLPTSTHQNASKIKQRQNTWSFPSTAQT